MYKKEVHNIFENKKETITKLQKPLGKIIIDYREKNSLVWTELIKMGFEVDLRELKVGDYIVKDVIIERKEIRDFISSMINKRLISQLLDLQQFENKILLIEGLDEYELYNEKMKGINANAVRGFLLSIALTYKIPIIYSKNSSDTAQYIAILSKKSGSNLSLNTKKKPKNKQEQLQFILEGFPKVGPKSAKKLLEEFGSIKNICNAKKEEIIKILGKNGKILKKLIDEFYD